MPCDRQDVKRRAAMPRTADRGRGRRRSLGSSRDPYGSGILRDPGVAPAEHRGPSSRRRGRLGGHASTAGHWVAWSTTVRPDASAMPATRLAAAPTAGAQRRHYHLNRPALQRGARVIRRSSGPGGWRFHGLEAKGARMPSPRPLTQVHLTLEFADDDPAALLRVLSVLHRRRATPVELHLNGSRAELLVQAPDARARRVESWLQAIVSVKRASAEGPPASSHQAGATLRRRRSGSVAGQPGAAAAQR